MARSFAWTNPRQQTMVEMTASKVRLSWRERVQHIAAQLRINLTTLYYASRHPRTPWYAKLLALLVMAYALSPIDLIPDFIPVIGYLDDLLIIPAGFALAVALIPREVMAEARQKALQGGAMGSIPTWLSIGIIIVVWMVLLAGLGWLAWNLWQVYLST
jgi:uncharacterized membrane protein YkvA (DUF1232 family)